MRRVGVVGPGSSTASRSRWRPWIASRPAVVSVPGEWRFVAAALAACLGCLAAVLALNLLVDPFAIAATNLAPSAVETDRATKLTLVQRLEASPEILILGSSRARQAEPSFLQTLTRHSGFNAGVTGGNASDALVFMRFTADRFPGAKRRYIWFVDAGVASNGVNPQLSADPRATRYLQGGGGRFGLKDLGTYLSFDASRASLRVLDRCVLNTCEARLTYRPDGSIPHESLAYLPEQTKSLKADAAALVTSIRAHPPQSIRPDPARYLYFERALAFMNARGERPVIVFNPVYPSVLAELERYRFPARAASLAYLRQLHHRYDFVVVNCQDIRTWGGSARNFTNPTHVDWLNMRTMLRYVVLHSDHALS